MIKRLWNALRSNLFIILLTALIIAVAGLGATTVGDVSFGPNVDPFWQGITNTILGDWRWLLLALFIAPTIGIRFLVLKRMLDDKNILPRKYQPRNINNKKVLDKTAEETIMEEGSGTKTEEVNDERKETGIS